MSVIPQIKRRRSAALIASALTLAGTFVPSPASRQEMPTAPAKQSRKLYCADLFCGAGGATEALVRAAAEMGYDVELVAVNHWDVAIDTHTANYPGFIHFQQLVGKVDPRKAVPGGFLDILMAGPECTHFSKARGKKPKNKQSRANAFDIIHWLEVLDVRNVLIENVEEFMEWGPLDENDQPIKALEGYFFNLFIDTLEELGYTVEHRILCAADHGDPTSRKRFFLQAIKHGAIAWPAPTFFKDAKTAAAMGGQVWRSAEGIIDWSLQGESIYERKRDLVPNTMRRIFAGMRKFSPWPIIEPEPTADGSMPTLKFRFQGALSEGGGGFPALIVPQFSSAEAKDTREPVGTITTTSRGIGLATPFLSVNRHHRSGPQGTACALSDPLRTLTTGGNMALCQPVAPCHTLVTPLLPFGVPNFGEAPGQAPRVHDLREPLITVTGAGAGCLACPYVVTANRTTAPTMLSDPLTTITAAGNHHWLATPALSYLVNLKGKSTVADLAAPSPTITSHAGHLSLATPRLHGTDNLSFVLANRGGDDKYTRCASIDAPLQTVTTDSPLCLVNPSVNPSASFLLGFTHTAKEAASSVFSLDRPVPTLTTKLEHGLVTPRFTPFFVGNGGPQGAAEPRSISRPFQTLLAENRTMLIEPLTPFLANLQHSTEGHESLHGLPCERRCRSISEPLQTMTTTNGFSLFSPWLYYGYTDGRTHKPHPGHSIFDPMPTVTAEWNHLGLLEPQLEPKNRSSPFGDDLTIEPFLIRYNGGEGGENRSQSLHEPISTLDTGNRFALCQFVVKYYGNGEGTVSLADPLATVTTKDRFALVELVAVADGLCEGRIVGWIDILYRMLQPHELARAHSFRKEHILIGKKGDQTKQVGNSWPIETGKCILLSMLSRAGGIEAHHPMPKPIGPSLPGIVRMRQKLDAPMMGMMGQTLTLDFDDLPARVTA